MTHVSNQLLVKETEEKLFKQFASLFATTKTKDMSLLFSDLFTPAEKIMFIKRIGIIMLLHQNQTSYRVAELLKVSHSTVRRLAVDYDNGRFDNLIGITRKGNFDSKKFWKTLEVLLRLGMPEMGKGRWKGFGLND